MSGTIGSDASLNSKFFSLNLFAVNVSFHVLDIPRFKKMVWVRCGGGGGARLVVLAHAL